MREPLPYAGMTSATDPVSASDDASPMDLKLLQAELDALRLENETLKKELSENAPDKLKEMAARAQADLQNAKDRMDRDARDLRKFAVQSVIEKLLPVVDHFRRAFGHLPEDLKSHDWVKGIEAVEQDMMRILRDTGLSVIECKGLKADPVRHEVLRTAPGELDVILEVYEDGYVLHDKVLRPAKVMAGDGTAAVAT